MSYIKPSVLVYQELQNAGGVANVTPDLGAVIVGPLFNNVKVDPADAENLTLTQGASTSDFSADLRVDLTSTFAGQKVLPSSVRVYGSDVFVKTSEWAFNADDLITLAGGYFDGTGVQSEINFRYDSVAGTYGETFTPSGGYPDVSLPDGSGNHIKVGDKIVFEYQSFNPFSVTYTVPATNTVEVTTTSAHGLSIGDKVVVKNVAGGTVSNGTKTVTAIVSSTVFQFAQTGVAGPGAFDYRQLIKHETVISQLVTGTTSGGAPITTGIRFSSPLAGISATRTSKAYSVTGTNTITITDNAHGLTVGDEIRIKNATGVLGNAIYTISSVTPNTIVITQAGLTDEGPLALDYALVSEVTSKVYRFYDFLEVPKIVTAGLIDKDQIDITTANDDYITLDYGAAGFTAYANVDAIPGADENSYDVLSGKFHVAYKALRQDKYSTILTVADSSEATAQLGDANADNPLSLGVALALANTTTSVMAVSLEGDINGDLIDYNWTRALELLENQRNAYAIVPLTQEESIVSQFKTHVTQMSTPVNAAWRVAIVNTAIPSNKFIIGDSDIPLTTGRAVHIGDAPDTIVYLRDTALSGGPDFVASSVTPGDLVVITASSDPQAIGTWIVDEVTNGKNLKLEGFSASYLTISPNATITYYIVRELTRRQRAESVAATSTTLGSNRVWHVQPDQVGVNIDGVVTQLPGYYLCAAMAGMTAGFPVQQGFTNISVAGIDNLYNSNFYFTKEDLNIMAEAGTCLYVQDVQGGIPYCRHELTTDMTVLEYREIVKVKNWDFLSFYYYDKMKGFIGTWNITPDTLSNMKQVMIASSELLLKQKLPRIGAPLLSYQTPTVEQDANNKDMVNIRLQIETVTPNNYTNIYLVI